MLTLNLSIYSELILVFDNKTALWYIDRFEFIIVISLKSKGTKL